MKTRQNERWNESNNSLVCGFLKLCTFLSHPLQNNNLKSSKFTRSENRNPDGKLFKFPFGIIVSSLTFYWCYCVILWQTVETSSLLPNSSWKYKLNLFFNQGLPQGYCHDCLGPIVSLSLLSSIVLYKIKSKECSHTI